LIIGIFIYKEVIEDVFVAGIVDGGEIQYAITLAIDKYFNSKWKRGKKHYEKKYYIFYYN